MVGEGHPSGSQCVIKWLLRWNWVVVNVLLGGC